MTIIEFPRKVRSVKNKDNTIREYNISIPKKEIEKLLQTDPQLTHYYLTTMREMKPPTNGFKQP